MPGVGPAAVATRPSFRRGFAVARDWINGRGFLCGKARNGNARGTETWKFDQLTIRVASLAFLIPNSRNLALSKLVWHKKMLLGVCMRARHVFAFFTGFGTKTNPV